MKDDGLEIRFRSCRSTRDLAGLDADVKSFLAVCSAREEEYSLCGDPCRLGKRQPEDLNSRDREH